jgi:hypothetical protein
VKWFDGGKINISRNCLDRPPDHMAQKPGSIDSEGEKADSRQPTALPFTLRFVNGLLATSATQTARRFGIICR